MIPCDADACPAVSDGFRYLLVGETQKDERFIQTALREWAYARAYQTSDQRPVDLPYWMHHYNWHRPHGSIGAKPPISTLGLTGNNPLRLHT